MSEIMRDAYGIADCLFPSNTIPTEIKVIILSFAGFLRYSRRSIMFVVYK